MQPKIHAVAFIAALACAMGALPDAPHAAQPQRLAAGEWFVYAPSKDFKDLPTLATEADGGGDAPGNMLFVCDRTNYYLLLIFPTVKFASSEPGAVILGDGADARYETAFKDLYGTRAPLGKKFDRDADIMFTGIPKALLARLNDNGTLQVDLKGQSWSMALKGIAAKVPSFTSFCETGQRLNRSHFAK
jgi:hypothetical protein